jgi:hypothetical protein
MIVEDAAKAQYMLVIIHTDYEQTVRLFANDRVATAAYIEQYNLHNEVYLSKIIAQRD